MSKRSKENFLFFLLLATIFIVFSVFFSFKFPKSPKPLQNKDFLSCATNDFLGEFTFGEKVAIFEGKEIPVEFAYNLPDSAKSAVLSVAAPSERWIEVDLSEQKLKAWDGESLFLETPVSTGLPWWPTPTGEYRIWIKLRYTKMEGGQGRYYYYLPNVPYVMYFENENVPGWRGYGLHGTYWHNDFGTQRSHGCVNLPTPIAEKLFYWIAPSLADGKGIARVSSGELGTRIIIHD